MSEKDNHNYIRIAAKLLEDFQDQIPAILLVVEDGQIVEARLDELEKLMPILIQAQMGQKLKGGLEDEE